METTVTNDVIFATQLASIVVFILALFGLYKSLVSQKDSVIQLQKEKIDFLKLQIETAKSSSPDILTERLSKRIELLKSELESLSSDHETSREVLDLKIKEVENYEKEMVNLKNQIKKSKELLENFTCPYCESPMVEHTFNSEIVEHGGLELDVDHEYIAFECGLTIVDNYEKGKCKYINAEV